MALNEDSIGLDTEGTLNRALEVGFALVANCAQEPERKLDQ